MTAKLDSKGRIDYNNAASDCGPMALTWIAFNNPKTGIVKTATIDDKLELFADLYDGFYRRIEAEQGFEIDGRGTSRKAWKKIAEEMGGRKVKVQSLGLTPNIIAEASPTGIYLAKTRKHVQAIVQGRVSNIGNDNAGDQIITTLYRFGI